MNDRRQYMFAWCLILSIASGGALRAAPPLADELRDSMDAQARLKAQTQSVAIEIGAVLAEFDRNGIAGEDVQTLRAIRGVLGSLSEAQMQQVVDLLQKARAADSDDAARRRNLTQAVVGQKSISSQLGDLLKEYHRQQATYALSGRLERLAERQNENFKQAVQLAKATAGKPPEQFPAAAKDALRVQQAEQAALSAEVRQAMADLTAMAQDPQAAPPQVADAARLAREAKLDQAAATAADELKTGNVYRAATNEMKVRDALRDLSRAVAPPRERAQQLTDAATKVDQAIAEQAKLIEETKAADKADPAPEQKQADLVDTTNLAQRDVQQAAPAVAEKLKAAEQRMQQARGDLAQKKNNDAAPKQQAALAALNEAKADLQQEIAKATASPDAAPKDALAAVADLLQRTRRLRSDQASVAQASAAATVADAAKASGVKQATLRTTAVELKSESATAAPLATSSFTAAEGMMARAARVLAEPTAVAPEKKAAVAEQQKQVDAALAEAIKVLEESAAALEQAKTDLAQVEEAKAQVAQLMQDQQKLNTDTAKAAESPAAAPKPQDLAKQQQQMQQAAEAAQQELPKSAQAAQQAMQTAQQAMQQAQKDLAQNQPQAAKPDQQQAMSQLSQANQALDKAAEQLQQQLQQQPAQPADPRRTMGELASAIERAQQQIDQSSEKLPPKESGDPERSTEAGRELERTQNELAKLNAEESDQLPGEARKAIEQANESLTDAAAKAAANKASGAKEDAQAASDQLENAKAALKLAMEGLPSGLPPLAQASAPGAPKPGDAKPGPPGPPGPPQPGEVASEVAQNADPTKGNESAGGAVDGPLGNANGAGKFVALPERERQALLSSGAAKYPEEYGPMIEQYLRNLSNPAAQP